MRAVALSVLILLSLTACKPSGGMTTEAMQTTPAEPGETPAPLMSDSDAASATSLASQAAAESPAASLACSDEIGQAAAQKLADQCVAVSPATHPPCNVGNTCQMMRDEIKRSCDMYKPGETKPAECTA